MTTKKTAKKQVTKCDHKQELVKLLTERRQHPVIIAMARRHVGLPAGRSTHPQNIDDILHIRGILEDCPFIKLTDMVGFCKIWDAIVENWKHIEKMSETGDYQNLKQFLKELSAPYLVNVVTGDYSKSIYG
jgi:hypothetical protein